MKTVQTVLGNLKTDQLGSVLMHEHICSSSMGISMHYPQFYKEGYHQSVVSEMRKLKENGISTVVDATCVCLGRDVRELKRISEETGVNIIATTGWWGIEPPYLGPSTEEKWAQCFIDDVTKGCDGTDIKAGYLKAAMDREGPTDWKIKIHHAVGMAQIETGLKIMLHSYCPAGTPIFQLKALREVGVDLNNVVVEHIPETTDLDMVKWIYDQGAWLGINRIPTILFPGEYSVPVETRISFIKQILDAGMGDRMLFSHDLALLSTLYDNQSAEMNEYILEQIPDKLLYIKNHLFRRLAEQGYDYDYLWNLTIDNPRRFFEG